MTRGMNERICLQLIVGVAVIIWLVCLASCTPRVSYPLYLHYRGSGEISASQGASAPHLITVAAFQDQRPVENKAIIGHRVGLDGEKVHFISSGGYPGEAVTAAFRDYCTRRGYTVGHDSPPWGLDPADVAAHWGDWVVGGTIEELLVLVKTEHLMAVYECRLAVAVVMMKRIEQEEVFRERIALSSSKKEPLFSVNTAQEMINSLLTQAVDETMGGLAKK